MVTEHTNDTEQSSPESAAQQQDTQGERLWYAIHTYSGYENKVKSHLEARINSRDMRNKIFRVIVPMEEEVRSSRASGAQSSAKSSRATCWWRW